MRNLILAAAVAVATLGCGQKKTEDNASPSSFDAALPPGFDAGPLGALYLLTIWPPSTAAGETVTCNDGFCSHRATHHNSVGGMSLVANDAGLNLLFEARVGSTVTFDGHETKITQARQDAVFPHMLARFADMPVRERFLEVDVKVVTPGMKSESAKSVLDLTDLLRSRVMKAKDGPVLFPGETPATPNAKKLAYLPPRDSNLPPVLIGRQDGRWRDVDLVAFVDNKPGQGAACPEVKGAMGIGGPHPTQVPYTPHLNTLHSDVTLVERRTGKVFDKSSFDSAGKCRLDPPDASADPSKLDLASLSQSPTWPSNQAAIETWIASKLTP